MFMRVIIYPYEWIKEIALGHCTISWLDVRPRNKKKMPEKEGETVSLPMIEKTLALPGLLPDAMAPRFCWLQYLNRDCWEYGCITCTPAPHEGTADKTGDSREYGRLAGCIGTQPLLSLVPQNRLGIKCSETNRENGPQGSDAGNIPIPFPHGVITRRIHGISIHGLFTPFFSVPFKPAGQFPDCSKVLFPGISHGTKIFYHFFITFAQS